MFWLEVNAIKDRNRMLAICKCFFGKDIVWDEMKAWRIASGVLLKAIKVPCVSLYGSLALCVPSDFKE